MVKKIWRILRKEGFGEVSVRTLDKTKRLIRDYIEEMLAHQSGTYSLLGARNFPNFTTRLKLGVLNAGGIDSFIPESVARHYLDHRFDLLGSGWTRVRYGQECRGMAGYHYKMGPEVTGDSSGQWLLDRLNRSNRTTGVKIWCLVDKGYLPIDWQLDFKSGYRWCEKIWSKRLSYGHRLGVDIKVPWELSRMQHLPQLAIASVVGDERAIAEAKDKWGTPKAQRRNKNKNGTSPGRSQHYAREFRNQLLDFIATNPPNFGVNWVCPMDVAIRSANWLIAYDIFRSANVVFDDRFETIFISSIYDHGSYLVRNLEWRNRARGNHYLANIAGLTFIAAYLPSTKETDAWLAFSIQELINEVQHQFYSDGGNFEGSTAYHRLSAEMVFYATALILGLPRERMTNLHDYDHTALKSAWRTPQLKPGPVALYMLPKGSKADTEQSPFPQWYYERMERMIEFILDITKSDGRIPQIGDNDSGRFLKLSPRYKLMNVEQAKRKYANLQDYNELPSYADYYLEDHLDCSHLVETAYGLFRREDFASFLNRQDSTPRNDLVGLLSAGAVIGSQRMLQRCRQNKRFLTNDHSKDFKNFISTLEESKETVINTFRSQEGGLIDELVLRPYPDFGLYIYRSRNLFLAIRCWPARTPYHSGHMHSDNLSIELIINGREAITDPGTYVYTPLPRLRNQYRSSKSHFTPCISDDDLSSFDEGLFTLSDLKPAYIRRLGFKEFQGELFINGKVYGMACTIDSNGVTVYHYCYPPAIEYHTRKRQLVPYSSGYGVVEVADSSEF